MEKKEIFNKIEYIVACVGAFASRFLLSNAQAYASSTFSKLNDPECGLYYQGAVYIFQFLKSEIETGKIA